MKALKNEVNFTEAKLKDIPTPATKRTFYTDTKQPGLRLQVTPAGTKSFQCRAWSKELQKPITVTLGRFPAITVIKARALARETVSQISDGLDLEAQRQQQRLEMTCSEMFDSWFQEYGTKLRSGQEVRGVMARYVERTFGSHKISRLTQSSVQVWYNRLLESKKKNGQPLSAGTANNALRCLKAVFNKFLPPSATNPCEGVKKTTGLRGERFLDGSELQRFLEAVEADRKDYGDSNADFFLICLYTGARSGNVRSMKWANIKAKGTVWEISSTDSKNQKPMGIALSDNVQEILERRREAQTRAGIITPFVFPASKAHPSKTGHITKPRKGWVRVCDRAELQHSQGVAGLRMHDLRHTLASQLALAGCSLPEIQQAMGHKDSQTTQRYMHLSPSKSVVEQAANRMQQQVEKAADKIAGIGGF